MRRRQKACRSQHFFLLPLRIFFHSPIEYRAVEIELPKRSQKQAVIQTAPFCIIPERSAKPRSILADVRNRQVSSNGKVPLQLKIKILRLHSLRRIRAF